MVKNLDIGEFPDGPKNQRVEWLLGAGTKVCEVTGVRCACVCVWQEHLGYTVLVNFKYTF